MPLNYELYEIIHNSLYQMNKLEYYILIHMKM